MSDRGKARSYTSAVGSNYLVKAGSGSLYGITAAGVAGGAIRVENSLNLGAAPDMTAISSNATLAYIHPLTAAPTVVTYTPGLGFDDGLVVAATSNVRFTVIYE